VSITAAISKKAYSIGTSPGSKMTIKGLVFKVLGKMEFEDVKKPKIEKPREALLKIGKITICGTDLGILHGKTPSAKPQTTLGHEGVGIVEEAGGALRNFKKVDRVIISCITACGSREYCKKQMSGQCEDGRWILDHLINGTQADYVRIPHADNSLYAAPAGKDEEALVMCSDTLLTGHEIGVINGCAKPGNTMAIIGAEPIIMSALLTAQFYSPAKIGVIDLDENSLKIAEEWGASETIHSGIDDAVNMIMVETKDGVDVAVEAVGAPDTFNACQQIALPGDHVANMGVQGKSVDLKIQDLWIRNINSTMGRVNTNTAPMLLRTVASEKFKPEKLFTHHFKLNEIMKAYELFGDAANEKALKIILTN